MNERFKLRSVVFLLAFTAAISYFSIVQRDNIKDYGVFTKAVITSIESYKGGAIIKFKYQYKATEYESSDGGSIGKKSIGKQFFIQILPAHPTDVTLLGPVPECLLNIEPSFEGWKKLPTCK